MFCRERRPQEGGQHLQAFISWASGIYGLVYYASIGGRGVWQRKPQHGLQVSFDPAASVRALFEDNSPKLGYQRFRGPALYRLNSSQTSQGQKHHRAERARSERGQACTEYRQGTHSCTSAHKNSSPMRNGLVLSAVRVLTKDGGHVCIVVVPWMDIKRRLDAVES
ncbi:hypothetical protein F5Y18DRAFT_331682 [Xylariaceae sp. FL1019]|nr:hypothetical protein F5Y18DRAFT_331682 [Xylariaceae sp. FL1019]